MLLLVEDELADLTKYLVLVVVSSTAPVEAPPPPDPPPPLVRSSATVRPRASEAAFERASRKEDVLDDDMKSPLLVQAVLKVSDAMGDGSKGRVGLEMKAEAIVDEGGKLRSVENV